MSNVALESTITSAEEPEKIAEELVSRLVGGEPNPRLAVLPRDALNVKPRWMLV